MVDEPENWAREDLLKNLGQVSKERLLESLQEDASDEDKEKMMGVFLWLKEKMHPLIMLFCHTLPSMSLVGQRLRLAKLVCGCF